MTSQLFSKKFFNQYYSISLISGWTILIAISGIWNTYQITRDTIDKARIEARTVYQHNLAYRKWSTMHGGIYTKINQKNKDNPHFLLPMNRNEGQFAFAVVDPFQMTKQAYEVLHKQSPSLATISHTVSLDFRDSIDPYDKPDSWEKESLRILENGKVDELSVVMDINKEKYLRLLKPYVIERECLNCHVQGTYKVGAIRAGMSVAVPMEPYYAIEINSKKTVILTHLLIWFLGFLTISRFSLAFRQYRQTILENEEKFRIVSEFAYNFEYWIKPDNQLAFISPSCERLTGYTREEFEKDPKLLIDIIHPDDLSSYRKHVTTINAPCHKGSDYRIITKGGETRWFSHTCSPIHINGVFLGRRSSSVDITEHKALEDELQKAKRLEYLGKFAGGIAHDFNNVLGSINTFTHLIAEEAKASDSAILDYVKYIKIATKLGKNMTSNLLSFGKRQAITPQVTTLNTIIRNISDILKTLVDEEIYYTFKLDEQDFDINADPHQIEQILINLSTNARDAMALALKGGAITISSKAVTIEKPQLSLMGEIPAGDYMVLSVSDTGHGILPENIAKICEPFFTTKDASKGTGLGMSIISNIIKQHNAFLDVQSVPQEGTTFTVYIPTIGSKSISNAQQLSSPKDENITLQTTESKAPTNPPIPSTPEDSTPAQITNTPISKTILLVDDDELIRKSLSVPLERMGYNILIAENGKQAIRQYIDNKAIIDLTLLDVILPYKNGKEVFDIIRRDKSTARIIFMSGYTDNILSAEVIAEEGVKFFSKPLDFEALQKTISEMIG